MHVSTSPPRRLSSIVAVFNGNGNLLPRILLTSEYIRPAPREDGEKNVLIF